MNSVNNPSHYKGKSSEAIDVIESFGLNFNLGNAIKYILRAGKKGPTDIDLKKAIWYLEREAASLENRRLEEIKYNPNALGSEDPPAEKIPRRKWIRQ